jgi:TolB-like protein
VTSLDVVISTHRPTNKPRAQADNPTVVMPFTAATPEDVTDADSITSDIIFGVAKLRSISIIAQGTVPAYRRR